MLFSSITFLYYFLPLMALAYFIVPKPLKNSILLLGSMLFYGWGEPKYILLMVISIGFGFGFGICIEKAKEQRHKKILTGISVAISLSFLLYFKYTDFFIENVNAVTGLSLPLLKIALPIGISFYTFQMISYTLDVYRGEPAQKNLIHLATYIAMFPQLIAGPIVRYSDIAEQLKNRSHSFEKAAEGIYRFVFGLGKKILLANQLGELCQSFRLSDEKSILFYWLYGIAFTLHIYFDFSGYSDMAIGLGKIFGFDFLENFNYPYIAGSITDFWRRWHISLSSWFRDYVYIPLGGNRVGKKRQMVNLLIVWFLTGFWHGAAWNFMMWGLFFAILLIMEKQGLQKIVEKNKWISHVYVMFLVMISFILFNAENLGQAFSDIAGLFGAGGIAWSSKEAFYYLQSYAFVLVIGIVGATPLPKELCERMSRSKWGATLSAWLGPIAVAGLMILMTAYLADGSFNPFLYFRF